MTHRGPFQPLPFCDCVLAAVVLEGWLARTEVFMTCHYSRVLNW